MYTLALKKVTDDVAGGAKPNHLARLVTSYTGVGAESSPDTN
jgi:hypothetical protein